MACWSTLCCTQENWFSEYGSVKAFKWKHADGFHRQSPLLGRGDEAEASFYLVQSFTVYWKCEILKTLDFAGQDLHLRGLCYKALFGLGGGWAAVGDSLGMTTAARHAAWSWAGRWYCAVIACVDDRDPLPKTTPCRITLNLFGCSCIERQVHRGTKQHSLSNCWSGIIMIGTPISLAMVMSLRGDGCSRQVHWKVLPHISF